MLIENVQKIDDIIRFNIILCKTLPETLTPELILTFFN